MSVEERLKLLSTSAFCGVASIALLSAMPAYAQDADEPDEIEEIAEEEEETDDRVVVTGSRIRRDSFSSTAPLQVIDGVAIQDAGLVSLEEVLVQNPVFTGTQLDLQFNDNFVSNAGPGGAAANLRGLGADRTLLLINGRRYAPAGIEGAPAFPDISLIPVSMIQTIDILLDGASSVYGSDAVAGVINVNLIDEFEGFRIQGTLDEPFEDGGGSSRISFIMGDVGERGSFALGGEIEWRDRLDGCSRDWMETIRIDPGAPFDGVTMCGPIDIVEGNQPGVERRQRGDGGINQQFIAYPGGAIALGDPGDSLGYGPFGGAVDGFYQWPFAPFDEIYGGSYLLRQNEQILPIFQSQKLYLTADYDLSDVLEGTEAFVEFNLSNRQSESLGNYEVIDAVLTDDNPFNQFAQAGFTGAFGFPAVTTRPWQPWRDRSLTELTQYRMMSGLRGDLGFAGAPGWDYEVFAGYTRSIGFSQREGIDEENLIRSLNAVVDPATGNIVCADAVNPGAPFSPGEVLQDCVPFNPLDLGLWKRDGSAPELTSDQAVDGDLIIDYLRTNRNVTTFVDEWIVGGYATGPAWQLPAGEMKAVVGFEYRDSSIDTRSSDVAENGGLSGFFRDLPTRGSVDIFELFGEVFVPLIKDAPLIYNLEVEAAARYTEHEFYGSNYTYSGKLAYQPVEYLTIRGTVGTSFRAPNLRELFLAGQTNFGAVGDPCQVPFDTLADTDGDGRGDTYDPALDVNPRSQTIIDNCVSEGLDPFTLGAGVAIGSIEQANAGNQGLDPEESFAYSAGFVFDQPWFDSFDFRFGLTYWDITVDGAVLTPTAGFLVSQCYNSVGFSSPFCTRRRRDPNTGYFQLIDITPFNVAEDRGRGVDLNSFIGYELNAFDKVIDLSINAVATYQAENSELLQLEGESIFTDEAGDLNNPRWRGQMTARADVDNWSFFWQTQLIGAAQANFGRLDPLAGAGADPLDPGSRTGNQRPTNCYDLTRTTAGAADPLDLPSCYTTEPYLNHTVSLGWNDGSWNVRVGIQNVFDHAPPQLDEDVGGVSLNSRSVPIGVGYDIIGRSVFFNIAKTF